VPLPGRWDRWCWNPGTPFFPLVESGFENLSTQRVNAVTHLELGVAEEVAVFLAGHEPSQSSCFGVEGVLEPLVDGVGLGLLFGCQGRIIHGALSWRARVSGQRLHS
jgi:hypothetical protein